MEDYLTFEDLKELTLKHEPPSDSSQILHNFERQILSGKPQDEVLNYIFEALAVFVPFDRVSVALKEGDTLRSIWVKSHLPVENLRAGYSAPVVGSSLRDILNTGRPRVIGDLDEYFADHPNSKSTALILRDGMKSSLTFPLKSAGTSFGVVFFSSAKKHGYTLGHLKTLESVAQGLSLVIERAQLASTREYTKSQDKVLSRVVHDLRSPLSTLTGFVDLLVDSPDYQHLSASSQEWLGVVKKNSQVLMNLIEDLMEFQTLRLNSLSVRKATVALKDFLKDVQGALSLGGRSKSLTLEIDSERAPPYWNFDAARIRQVLENLVSNAFKFSRQGDTVQIRVRENESRLHFTVSDHGVGIAEEDIPKLFVAFAQTGSRPTGGEKSTGLGLAICRQIVKAHGGEIEAHSQLGLGSTFEFWLPHSQSSS